MTTRTTPSTAPRGGPHRDRHQRALLAVLAGNMLLDALEVSVVMVAAPAIGTALELPPHAVQWTVTGFAAGFGGLLLLGARLVERLGRRRVYLVALLAFAAASLVAAAATGPVLLAATRVVKGGCAALTAPTGLAIILRTFPDGPRRRRAVSVYTLFGAAGFTLGLLLSGLLTAVDWRLTLAFPAPVALALCAVGFRVIPRDAARTSAPRPVGAVGALLLTAALLALVSALAGLPEDGWRGGRAAVAFGVCAALLAAYVVHELRSADPLVPRGWFAHRTALRAALGAAALNGSYLGLLFVLTFQFRSAWGWGPLRTALALLPASAPLAASAWCSGWIVARWGAARLVAAGSLAATTGYALCLWHGPAHGYPRGVLPPLLLVAAAFVLAFAALNTRAASGVPAAGRATAIAVYQTAVQLGAAVTVAAVAALLATGPGGPAGDGASDPAARQRALALVTVVGAAGLLVSLPGLARRSDRGAAEAVPVDGPG